jgi:hypothetical protein
MSRKNYELGIYYKHAFTDKSGTEVCGLVIKKDVAVPDVDPYWSHAIGLHFVMHSEILKWYDAKPEGKKQYEHFYLHSEITGYKMVNEAWQFGYPEDRLFIESKPCCC